MPETNVTVADMTCGIYKAGRKSTPCTLATDHDGEHYDIEGNTWFNHGPIQRYEITWMSGHVETIPAHQVAYPHRGLAVGRRAVGMPADEGAPRVQLHAEIDGRWLLMLSAREEDIRTMRNVTGGERL
ncbi:hypothetical protein AB0L22_08650 [Micromonospora haikouensis]|uniref:hypothetical protein n=1 Tax=Micromonospora haikouensis TaxID=686309 RepID=UPI0034334936